MISVVTDKLDGPRYYVRAVNKSSNSPEFFQGFITNNYIK